MLESSLVRNEGVKENAHSPEFNGLSDRLVNRKTTIRSVAYAAFVIGTLNESCARFQSLLYNEITTSMGGRYPMSV